MKLTRSRFIVFFRLSLSISHKTSMNKFHAGGFNCNCAFSAVTASLQRQSGHMPVQDTSRMVFRQRVRSLCITSHFEQSRSRRRICMHAQCHAQADVAANTLDPKRFRGAMPHSCASAELNVTAFCVELLNPRTDSIQLPGQDPIEYSELVRVLFVAPEASSDFDKEALLHLTERPLVSLDHVASPHKNPMRSRCFERKASHLAFLECRKDLASCTHSRHKHLWRERHIQVLVRQMRVGAPSERQRPVFCHLQCLITFQKPHETATAGVLPAAAWVRRII